MKIVKDGNLHFWIRTGLSFVGAGAIFLSVLFIHEKTVMWVAACLGLGLGAIGYYSAQAAIFGVKPFANKPVQHVREKETPLKNNRAMKLLLITMISSSIFLHFFASLSNYGALAILVWTSLCCWNVYAFFKDHDMWPYQFFELKASGNVSGRTFVLWVSVGIFFLGLVGIAWQAWS